MRPASDRRARAGVVVTLRAGTGWPGSVQSVRCRSVPGRVRMGAEELAAMRPARRDLRSGRDTKNRLSARIRQPRGPAQLVTFRDGPRERRVAAGDQA